MFGLQVQGVFGAFRKLGVVFEGSLKEESYFMRIFIEAPVLGNSHFVGQPAKPVPWIPYIHAGRTSSWLETRALPPTVSLPKH